MNREILNKPNIFPTFIGSWTIEPILLCDELIDYFENNKYKQKQGRTTVGLNRDQKDSTDILINPKDILIPGNEIFKKYFDQLFECHKDYVSQWDFLKSASKKYEIGSFNLQKYKAGQHFKQIHTERFSLESLHRVFAFMTYLNDVQEGGATYFSHYDLEIKPKKGLTLIWPAEWTHAHRGNTLNSGLKYIITGWMNFTY